MNLLTYIATILLFSFGSADQGNSECEETQGYIMPAEWELHEGTWLQWPHHYQYGKKHRNELDATWVAITKALVTSENVHLIAYSREEQYRITDLLADADIPMENIDFLIAKTNDVWVRDNGPIYVKYSEGKCVILDFGFNGWGRKTAYKKCNSIPESVAAFQNIEWVNLNKKFISEGGAIELDGNGTLLACKSAVLNPNRNPRYTQTTVETVYKKYLGVAHFIWLEGKAGVEITDQHIDGFAKFAKPKVIITMQPKDLLEFDVAQQDIETLYAAKDKDNIPYDFVKVPLTQYFVSTTNGNDLGYKGSYVNYYIGNEVVLVPNYNDPNDSIANTIIQSLYPKRTVVGIDVRNLYAKGGMVHCVTQQQP